MDLASFIPGITNTASFSPGATTPPPFNVAHTGLTDGTSPATASANMAEIYNRLLLNIASTVTAAGITIDNNNWTQLPAAVKKIADDAVAGFASTVSTAAQFDNSGSISTTAFVQRALGNVRGIQQITGNISLTAADAGKAFILSLSGAGVLISIDPTGLIPGSVYTFIGDVTYSATVILTGASFKPTAMFNGISAVIRSRSQYQFVWDGTYLWPINGGGANQLRYVAGDYGYVVQENGLIFQWARDTMVIGEVTRTIAFNISFPTACFSVSLTGRSDGTTLTNNNVPQLVSMTANDFTYMNQGFAEDVTPVGPNQGVYWFAIGY